MEAADKILNDAQWHAAHAAISAWKNSPDQPQACPRCGKLTLSIADHSARPYAEWYGLSCAACELDVAMHLPMAPPPSGGM